MKPVSLALVCAACTFASAGCGAERNPSEGSAPAPEPSFVPVTFADSVAAAHGFGNWDAVERLDFAFAVDVADTNRVTRDWSWFPRVDSVVRRGAGGAPDYGYRRSERLDSLGLAADGAFINDSYWLLMPFYLIWSAPGYESVVTYRDTLPLARSIGNRLTVQYRPTGGYTPGDAYDLYVDTDYRLQEWAYRPGGGDTATLTMTWADYATVGGLLLPGDHRGDRPARIHHPRRDVLLLR